MSWFALAPVLENHGDQMKPEAVQMGHAFEQATGFGRKRPAFALA